MAAAAHKRRVRTAAIMPKGVPVARTDPVTGLHKPGFRVNNKTNAITCEFTTTREWHDAIAQRLTGWGCASVGEFMRELVPHIPNSRPGTAEADPPPTDPPNEPMSVDEEAGGGAAHH